MIGRKAAERIAREGHLAGESWDDATIVACVRAGNERAFERLYRAYISPLASFANAYVHEPQVAEELAQDVLCRIWERRTEWTVEGTVRSYLFLAVRNRAFSWLRRRRADARWTIAATVGDAPNGMSESHALPDQQAEVHELEQALAAAMAALPERGRMAYTLRWHHRLSVKEVASVMGISEKGAEMAILRATHAVREQLASYR